MHITFILWVLIWTFLDQTEGKVVETFSECSSFFYKGKVPNLGTTYLKNVRLCQLYQSKYHFATLYNTIYRTAVYSAYLFEPTNAAVTGHDGNWFLEPQLVNPLMTSEMIRENDVAFLNDGVYLGEKQALNEDYNNFARGHLNPSEHHAGDSCVSTYTLTNVVPQNHKLNTGAWRTYQSDISKMFNQFNCHQTYVLVGAIPSTNNWIVKNNVNRVNIPDYIWNAYCCVDQNGHPILSGAATAANTENNVVIQHSLDVMVAFLKNYAYLEGNELFSGHCKA